MTRYLVRFENGTASIVEADRIVSFEERASQYLAQGAIQVLFADGEHVAALCEGYSKTHRLGFEPHRGWWCSCHIQGECPHLIAVRSVVGTIHDASRRAEIEAEADRARARYRAAFDAELREREAALAGVRRELDEARAGAASLPQLESQLRTQALRLSELKAHAAQRRSEHRLELMQRDIRLNQLHLELQRLRARTQVAARPSAHRSQAIRTAAVVPAR